MSLKQLVEDIADVLFAFDSLSIGFKQYQAGVGPYGEPQLVAAIAKGLNEREAYAGKARVKRSPDLLIETSWALEFKILRPFGNDGNEAENWSVNLLHPYEGNVSLIGDCLKLEKIGGAEEKAVVVVGYEHTPARIALEPTLRSFEILAHEVLGIKLSSRFEARRVGLIHPVHQQLLVAAWRVLS